MDIAGNEKYLGRRDIEVVFGTNLLFCSWRRMEGLGLF